MYSGNTPRNAERWQLIGNLTTLSALHLGDGNTREIHKDERTYPKEIEEKWAQTPKYATVFMDHDSRPALPGTSLKGALRAWAVSRGLAKDLIGAVFGSPAVGGRVTFCDATLARAIEPTNRAYRFWSKDRLTCLTPKVAIDPNTGAAQDGLLYHLEYLIPGSVFSWTIEGRCVSEDERRFLLFVLQNAFRDETDSARVGADVADGWGKVVWEPSEVKTLSVREWLQQPLGPWRDSTRSVAREALREWLRPSGPGRTGPAKDVVTIKMTLNFSGAMLVNDPTRQEKRVEGRTDGVGHSTARSEREERPYLPASTIRGALRSQARRIWQTLARSTDQDLDEMPLRRLGASNKEDLTKLAHFQRLFGSTGWRSPIEIDDFKIDGDPVEHRQEFVAIDRFTGGAAERLKFSADALWKPRFLGTLRLRLDRWSVGSTEIIGPWGWLMMAYVLRDWMEGDGRIGFGAAKGYGAFRATVEVLGDGVDAATLGGILERKESALSSPRLEEWDASLLKALASVAGGEK